MPLTDKEHKCNPRFHSGCCEICGRDMRSELVYEDDEWKFPIKSILSDKEKQEIIDKYVNDFDTVRDFGNPKYKFWFSIIEQKVKEKLEIVEKEVVEKSDVRTASASGEAENNFDFGYDVKTKEVLSIIHKHKGE